MTSILDRWFDGIDEGWGIPAFLIVFVAACMAILIIAYSNADLHPDVIEAWSLGQTLQWGGSKHPPLMAWIARLWTSVFPARDWSMQLLAVTNSACALWMIDVIARQFGDSKKRILILLLLLLTPIYLFQAQRFNANSVLFATWPLAVYCFSRSFETRQTSWAIVAGLTAALTLLGKYYSVYLIIGFLFAALMHQDRARYFGSRAPWLSIFAGGLFLLPHLYWLVASGFSPFHYAFALHGGFTIQQSFLSGVLFLLGVAATLALPALVWLLIIRTHITDYLQGWKSLDPGLKLLLLIGAGTIISPPLVSLLLKSSLTSLWASQGLFIFVVVAVCAAKFSIGRVEIKRLAGAILVFTMLDLFIAPLHAYYRNSHPFSEGRNYYSLATRELMLQWIALTPLPLKIVSGDRLAAAISFYSPDHPEYVIPSSQTSSEWRLPTVKVLAEGWATMCFEDELGCLNWSKQVSSIALSSVSFNFVVQPQFFGRPGVSTRIYAVVVPPLQIR